MTDEEIKLKAEQILSEAWNEVLLKNLLRIENKNISLEVSEGETFSFIFQTSSQAGNVEIKYSPQPFIEVLIKLTIQSIKNNVAEYSEIPEIFIKDVWLEAVKSVAKILLSNFPKECLGFIESQTILAMEIETFQRRQKLEKAPDTDLQNTVDKILQRVNSKRRDLVLEWGQEISWQISAPSFLFAEIYALNLSEIKEAKKFYTAVKKFPDPINTVKNKYKDLDVDIIDKFTASIGVDSLAFDITCRDLNISLGKENISPSTRKRYLDASKYERQKISDEDADEAWQKFVDSQNEYQERIARRRTLLESAGHILQK